MWELRDECASVRFGAECLNLYSKRILSPLRLPVPPSRQWGWGAFPGHTVDDIQSGIGVVHNSLLFDRPEKSVVRAPFLPYPRSTAHGRPRLLPTPPWFVTHRRAHVVSERLTRFEGDHALRRVPGIFAAALRG